jgi:hypothetical protein
MLEQLVRHAVFLGPRRPEARAVGVLSKIQGVLTAGCSLTRGLSGRSRDAEDSA